MDILFIVERATYKSWLPVISLGGIATKIILASLDHHLKHIVPMILNILEDAHDLTSSIKGIYGILIDTLLLFDFIGLYSHTRRIMRSWSKANRDVSTKSFCEFTAIRQKGKSQNGCYKKIKRAKSTCAYQGGGGGGREKCSFLKNFGMLCFLVTPVLRCALLLLPYYRQICKILLNENNYFELREITI